MVVLDPTRHAESGRTAEIGSLYDYSFRKHNTWMGFGARHRIANRSALDFEVLATFDPSVDAVECQIIMDTVGAVDLRPRPAKNAPRPADLAADQRLDLFPLSCIGTLIDQDDCFAVTLMNCSGPVDEDGEGQPIQPDISPRAVLDVPYPPAFAFAGCRQRVEVTGTTPITVAGNQHLSVQVPRVGHENL